MKYASSIFSVMRRTLVRDVFSCSVSMSWKNRIVDVQLEVFVQLNGSQYMQLGPTTFNFRT